MCCCAALLILKQSIVVYTPPFWELGIPAFGRVPHVFYTYHSNIGSQGTPSSMTDIPLTIRITASIIHAKLRGLL